MAYSLIEQFSRDIDFFVFLPSMGCHFASAGSKLPRLLEENDILNEQVSLMIESHNVEDLSYEYALNPRLSSIININENSDEFRQYTRDFITFARKGFYSFDKTDLGDRLSTEYHLVAYPKEFIDRVNACKFWRKKLKACISVGRNRGFCVSSRKPFDINSLFDLSWSV